MVDQTQFEQTGQDVLLDLISRLRGIEGKYNLLRDRVLIVNQNMIEQYQKTSGETKIFVEDLRAIKQELSRIKETLSHMIKELEHFTRKEDLRVLEKYINLWNPMNFVTEEDVKRIIREYESSKKGGK